MKKKVGSMIMVALMVFGGITLAISGAENGRASTTDYETYEGTRSYSYTLYEAATYSYVDVYIQGAYSGYGGSFDLNNGDGVFYGRCVKVEVTSNIDEFITISVELGRKLICHDYEVQDLVVTKSYTFSLYSHQTTTFYLYAMCIDMHLDAPSEGIYYDLGTLASGDLYSVVKEISDSGNQGKSGQCAVWAVTDYAAEDDLKAYGASTYDIDRAQTILDDASVSYSIKENDSGDTYNSSPENTPGFSFYSMLVSISIVILFSKIRRKKNE